MMTVALATGCSPSDEDSALKRRLEAQARARPPRASMSLGYIHHLDGVDPGGPVTVSAAEGAVVEIRQAFVVISAVEAHLCEPAQPREGAKQGLLGPLEDLLAPPAYAHVPSSATRLGKPFVEDLLAESHARIVGEIAPPLGEYCSVYAVISPADVDVINRSDVDTADLVGKSLLIRGRWRSSTDASWQPFSSSSDARHVVELRAIDPNTGHHPLKVDDPSDSVMMLIDKSVGPDLFRGISADQLNGSGAANSVLAHVEEQLEVRKFKPQKAK